MTLLLTLALDPLWTMPAAGVLAGAMAALELTSAISCKKNVLVSLVKVAMIHLQRFAIRIGLLPLLLCRIGFPDEGEEKALAEFVGRFHLQEDVQQHFEAVEVNVLRKW